MKLWVIKTIASKSQFLLFMLCSVNAEAEILQTTHLH